MPNYDDNRGPYRTLRDTHTALEGESTHEAFLAGAQYALDHLLSELEWPIGTAFEVKSEVVQKYANMAWEQTQNLVEKHQDSSRR